MHTLSTFLRTRGLFLGDLYWTNRTTAGNFSKEFDPTMEFASSISNIVMSRTSLLNVLVNVSQFICNEVLCIINILEKFPTHSPPSPPLPTADNNKEEKCFKSPQENIFPCWICWFAKILLLYCFVQEICFAKHGLPIVAANFAPPLNCL